MIDNRKTLYIYVFLLSIMFVKSVFPAKPVVSTIFLLLVFFSSE